MRACAVLAEGGKKIAEADPEFSEAIDFVEFYRRTARYFAELNGINARGQGVVSPWKFSNAIPCSGVAAALAAGNPVILKPVSDTVMVTYQLGVCFWRGGVSRKKLQFVPCAGASQGTSSSRVGTSMSSSSRAVRKRRRRCYSANSK